MANPEHLKILKQGVKVWNRWREQNPEVRPDLSGSILRNSYLEQILFESANLRGADLRRANLIKAVLDGATLSESKLQDANLVGSGLQNAKLNSAMLDGAVFQNSNLEGADFSDAKVGWTSFGAVDLSKVRGLEKVHHRGASSIGADTLEMTAAELLENDAQQEAVECFYRAAGVEDHVIEHYRSRIGLPIQFYSAFISYSHTDQSFSRRLYADLLSQGIRCWLDARDLLVGDPILDAVNQAIRHHDKLLLCCSLASLTSSWVEDEIAIGFEVERKEKRRVLIPLDLDGALFDWTSGKAPRIRERLAANFRGWEQDPEVYDREFERVVEALRPEAKEPRS
jgi:uncharacterized protein YjbI with pentapeptide repeats